MSPAIHLEFSSKDKRGSIARSLLILQRAVMKIWNSIR